MSLISKNYINFIYHKLTKDYNKFFLISKIIISEHILVVNFAQRSNLIKL